MQGIPTSNMKFNYYSGRTIALMQKGELQLQSRLVDGMDQDR